MATIAIFGANGAIGHRLVAEALDRGHRVTAVVRDPATVPDEHERLTVTRGDVLDPACVSAVAEGRDVVVSAVGGRDGAGAQAVLRPAAQALVAGLHALGPEAPRLIMVGGAGSLRTREGRPLWDAPDVPDEARRVMRAHGDALAYLRTVAGELRWTSVSPAAELAPGERTGEYRTAYDELVADDAGVSRISTEDFAVAVVDEIEEGRHTGRRFTVGY
ncbi:NAD(P)-dependent oxidoreductase [Streptomyces radicis]|uniref:NAD-dependent epimerase/dehydratase family protein n=1 Tax=Streptomyces radicis TaxID=1750517 RepID=A0A3A9W4G5_9ACTN|nr:NAD(P)H-binding protein [Streptomyces radicis]RKN08135.1 NAD-dependent epimerase/dehydratase family protein [Streptomyces radicis]RKN20490.1 NAD-dependent epimerase/dehydratase family protein [Streptomyces radicis]